MAIYNQFQKDLELIAKVTKVLNELGEEIDGEFMYVHVELRAKGGGEKVGEWSDEIGPDSWYYQPLDV